MSEDEGGDAVRLANSVVHGEETAEAGSVEVQAAVWDGFEEVVEAVAELGDGPVDGDLDGDDAISARGDGDYLVVEGLSRADEGVQAEYGLGIVARPPVVVAPIDRVHDANANLLPRAPRTEVGVRLRGF